MTWLISRNKALDHLRSNQRHVADSIDADDDPEAYQIADERPNPMQLMMQAAETMEIRTCMESLDASPRQCLALAYYHGMSQSEIAEHITAPIGSVKAWVRRGLERLKKCLAH
jgi:RNA polymerase sigma-70 factor (ECF subfamily)